MCSFLCFFGTSKKHQVEYCLFLVAQGSCEG